MWWSHEPGGPNWFYNCAQICPRAETGLRRRQVIPRILLTPDIHTPDTVHPSSSAFGVLASHTGFDNNWCVGCTRGGCLDPLRPTQPGWGRGGKLTKVTVDAHVDTRAGLRGGCWCCGHREQWCLVLSAPDSTGSPLPCTPTMSGGVLDLFVGVYAARLVMVWSTCQNACLVSPRTTLGAPRQAPSASHAQILQNPSHRERRCTCAQEMGMGMGMGNGKIVSLALSAPPSTQEGCCGRRRGHSSLWSAPCPYEQGRLRLGNSS